MPPKTKMTREEVAVDLAERKINVVNPPMQKFRSESNSDLTRDPKDYSPLRTKHPNKKKPVIETFTHLMNEFER